MLGILQAYERVGGVDYLCRVAKKEPAIFLALLARVLPRQVDIRAAGRIDVMFGRVGEPGQAGAEDAVEEARRARDVITIQTSKPTDSAVATATSRNAEQPSSSVERPTAADSTDDAQADRSVVEEGNEQTRE